MIPARLLLRRIMATRHEIMNTTSTTSEGSKDILRILLSVLLPPVGVATQVGFGAQFWINVVLTLLGYIPGIIHAIYIILSRKG